MPAAHRPTTAELREFVAWVYTDRDGREQALQAFVPPGVAILLVCPEGDPNEAGVDVLARQAARLGNLRVRKRLFRLAADLEVYDGRTSPSPPPATTEPATDEQDQDRDQGRE